MLGHGRKGGRRRGLARAAASSVAGNREGGGGWRRSGAGGEAESGAAGPRGGMIRCRRAAGRPDPPRGQGRRHRGGQAQCRWSYSSSRSTASSPSKW
uniref:Uncharacterized protein n=1 Tax=Oryza rufipogon TaxID=4529 RepID=A0A0E0NW54_ORYRU